MKTNTKLRSQCQVNIEKLSSINPKYFKYISQFYLDHYKNPDYGLSEGDQYTNMSAGGKNPLNPEYVEGSPYYAEKFGPLEEYVPYPNGRIPNAHSSTKQLTVGASYLHDKGYIGASFFILILVMVYQDFLIWLVELHHNVKVIYPFL